MANNSLKLDTIKIQSILTALGRDKAWLARQIGKGRQWVQYDMQTGCLNRVNLYAQVFKIDAKELIK